MVRANLDWLVTGMKAVYIAIVKQNRRPRCLPHRQRAAHHLATVRSAITAALKDAGHLHIPKARRTTPPPRPSASTASIKDR